MARETSRISNFNYPPRWETRVFHSFSEFDEETDKEEPGVSINELLPNELLERIIAYLPTASIFRADSVCKRWHEIVASKSFIWSLSDVIPQKPWYFMFTNSYEPTGYAYDHVHRKWHGIELPCINTSNCFIASSNGLVCFLDNDNRTELFICNPITKSCRKLKEPPGFKISDYSALAISVSRNSPSYNVAIVKSKDVPDNFFESDISIDIYNSEKMIWETTLTEILMGWRGGDESVICNGVLYFLVYSTGGFPQGSRHALVAYNIANRSSQDSLKRNIIDIPFSLTCGRLMNLNEKLVMVGGIGKQARPDIIKGIGIWLLKEDRKWEEIAKMPQKYFQGFGELDDVFASSGSDNLIYIQSYGAPALLIFDMNIKKWKWSHKCPVPKKFPLQLFTGFCFEPRVDISP